MYASIALLLNIFGLFLENTATTILNFHNDRENSILASIFNNFEIKHSIIIKSNNHRKNEIMNVKRFSNVNIMSVIKSSDELVEYFKVGSFMNVKTIVIFKEKEFVKLIQLFQSFKELKIIHRVHHFTWLIFLENYEYFKDAEKLSVPYNCRFIICFQTSKETYKLLEVYNVTNRTFFTELGIFRNNKISLASEFLFLKRMDLNGTKLMMNIRSKKQNGVMAESLYFVLNETAKIINCQYDYRRFAIRGLDLGTADITGELHESLVPFNDDIFRYDFFGPMFKSIMNWYIKYPEVEERADYYIQPFHPNLWASILAVIIFGSIWSLLMKKLVPDSEKKSSFDFLFLSFESFCNQIGFGGFKKISFRILIITFRIIALVVVPIYGAEITSYLAIRIAKIPFNNLEEFIKNGEYNLAVYNDSFLGFYLRDTSDTLLRLIDDNFTWKYQLNETSTAFEKICREKLAIFFIDNSIHEVPKFECNLLQIQNPITYTHTGAIMKKNSEFRDVFNYILIRFRTSGLLKKLQSLADESVKGKPKSNDLLEPVAIKQMIQVFSIVGVGMILATLILIFEYFFHVANKT